MKKIISIVLGIMMMAILPVQARDSILMLSIEDGMNTEKAKAKLSGTVKFYFGNQKHPVVLKKLGSDVSNNKTNAYNKSDTDACNIVFLSSLLAFEKRAKQLGANAVINIESYYDQRAKSSTDQFECHAGTFVAGAALKGDFVKIADK